MHIKPVSWAIDIELNTKNLTKSLGQLMAYLPIEMKNKLTRAVHGHHLPQQ